MIFGDVLTRAYDECGYSSSPASAITARFTQYANDGLHYILAQPGMGRLLDSDDPFQFTTVTSQARYVMPEGIATIRGMSERTNNRTLEAMSIDRYRRADPNPTSDPGVPARWVPIGLVAVAVQPSTADMIFIKSSSASDGAGVTAYIEGLRTGGYRATSSVAMNGVTGVQIGSFTDWIEITAVYISTAAIGTISLLQTSGSGTLLATISVGHTRPLYFGFYLWPTPNSSSITYFVDFRREFEPFVSTNLNAALPLPSDFHPMLVDYVMYREFLLKADERAGPTKQRFDFLLKRLTFATQWTSDELPVMGQGRFIGHSRLGGMFPADTWIRG